MKHPLTSEDVLLENYEFRLHSYDGSATINGVRLVSKDDLKSQATKFVRMLVEFTNTLDSLPQDRWITISLKVFIKVSF